MADLRDRLAAAVAPRYTVDRELGHGGMGTVFIGRDPTLGREVAIKVLPPERATAVAVERFLREARLLAKLSHPGIVPIYDAGGSGTFLWFVMPRILGDTLVHRMAAGPLSGAEVRRLGIDLLHALEHAHAAGVIHRDIKPANIFLDGDRPMLADFGIALLDAAKADALTGTEQIVGTLRYMAPEQRLGAEATERSDVYALGVTLFEATTGNRWESSAAATTRTWQAIPGSLGRALRGALRADPLQRWPSAAAFRRELTGVGRRQWRRSLLVGAAVVIAAIGLVTVRGALASRPPPPSRAALVVLPFDGAGDSLGAQVARYAELQIGFSQIRLLPAGQAGRMTRDSALGVAHFVATGKFVTHNGKADELVIQVTDSAGRDFAPLQVAGDPTRADSWGYLVADSLVTLLFPTQQTEFRLLAGKPPNRLALDAYYEGQQLFQSGRWHEAEEMFKVAGRRDSQFVQARWEELIARQWQSLPYQDALANLVKRSGGMPEPLPRLLRAQEEPDLDQRIALYESLVQEYPYYPMIREMWANELFGRGPLIGRPLREGIEAFRQAARDIPLLNRPNTYTQTVWGAVRIGDERLAREQLSLRHAPKGDGWTNMLWLAVNGRFRRWLAVPARELMLVTADSADVATLSRAVRMGLDVDDPWDQDALARFVERKATTNEQRASALAAQATAMLLLGRPLEALRRLDRGAGAARHDPSYRLQSAEWRVLLPLLPSTPIALPPSAIDSGRQFLRAIRATDPLWPRAAWTLAVDAIGRNSRRECDSLIQAMLDASATAPWIADLAAYAAAFRLGAAGNSDSALVLSRRIHRVPDGKEIGLRGPFVRALVYLHRAEWRYRQGDLKGAESEWLWHENNDIQGKPQGEPEQGELDAALSAVARLLRAENLPALDRGSDACAMFDRVATLWRDAEPVMKPLQNRVAAGRTACRH